jgi:hypothetical protein
MVDKCANPACSATFRRLRDGRLFVTEVEADYQSSASRSAHQRQYFWLCNSCCRIMTVIAEKGKRVQVVALPVTAIAARAVS